LHALALRWFTSFYPTEKKKKVRAGTRKKKTKGRGKTPGGRGVTMGRVESKKRGEGGREKETEEGTEEVSRKREATERGSGETDEGRGGTAETKRGRRHLLSGSGSTGNSCTGAVKKLVEEDESGIIGVSSVREEDESD